VITLPATTATSVRHGVLIDITVNTTTYTIANTFGPITYSGTTYVGLGNFLGMNEIQDDLRATTAQLQLSLSGIPKTVGEAGLGTWTSYVSLILNSRLKGSRVRIFRAFFSDNYEVLTDSVSLRFSGYVSNYTISDSTDIQSRSDTYTCVLALTNVLGIIERRIAGRRTNATDQKTLYPGDTGMDRVVLISNTAFDFGKPYTGGGIPGGAGSGGLNQPSTSNYTTEAG
jgi:hypothetical protein